MKKHSMPEMKEGGVNVTPLIDIVMCLIIFFMLVTKIGVSRGVDKDIKLPAAILGKPLEDMGNALDLNVHYSRVSNSPQVVALVDHQKRDLPLLSGTDHTLERVLKEFKRIHQEKSKVIIRADDDLPYEQLEQVLMAIANASIIDTAYETTKPKAAEAQ